MDNKLVQRKDIRWKVIQGILAQENIKLTVKRVNDYYTERSSGMGKIAELDYCFLLFEHGIALLSVTLPKTEKQRKAIERLAALISEAESERFSQFPILGKKFPGLNVASRRIGTLKENRRVPSPNLHMEIPEVGSLVLEWGCPNIALREESMKKLFPMARTIEL